ncbi:MAG: glycosyltransferase family 9 protein [Burkholderiales bacterium]|nr:glycosyltransferase family 9 protein [Burkholderiales bacterium]
MTTPILIRLPNYVGDTVLSLPAVNHLVEHGFSPVFVGKRWAIDLLGPWRANDWQVHTYPARLRDRVMLLRRLRVEQKIKHAHALLIPNSFSSALEARLAGFAATGYRADARDLLLRRGLVKATGRHEMDAFLDLAFVMTGTPIPAQHADAATAAMTAYYRTDAEETALADDRLRAAGITGDFIAVCPFAGGKFEGQSKLWPGFPELVARLCARGPVVICPGNADEQAIAQRDYSAATLLNGVGLAALAALLSRASCVVANDTGPGHLAAAVGARLISVQGPGSRDKYFPRGPSVTLARRAGGWPTVDAVMRLVGA